MRRAIGIGVVAALLVVLAGVGIGVAAYHAGESHAVVQSVVPAGDAAPGPVHGYGYRRGWGPGFGFFPFGFFLFPLLLIGTFLLIRLAFWRGRWGGGRWGGPGPWGPGGQWSQQGPWGPWGYGPWGPGPAGRPGQGPGQPPTQQPGPEQGAQATGLRDPQGGPEQGAQATGLRDPEADDEPDGPGQAWHPEEQAGGQPGRTARREDDPGVI